MYHNHKSTLILYLLSEKESFYIKLRTSFDSEDNATSNVFFYTKPIDMTYDMTFE